MVRIKELITIILFMIVCFISGVIAGEKDVEKQLRTTGTAGWFVTITCNK